MGDSSQGKVICAICYEEAKPSIEELQSISLCGHVFHELCLQQWLEYCPRGKFTCPLCKQQCADKDVHRLYFQSATEATQACQESCSGLPCNGDDVGALQATVHKLTGQLLANKSSMEAYQEQLQESSKQLSLCILRAERAESDQAEANKEKCSLKDTVSRIQEELKRSTAERCKLLERNSLLTKELASVNLTQNLDVNEDDIARMARVGCSNKDDVINTLTRSLIVRNRAYKDLMAKCNGLGTGENKALRQCEKAAERIKALKARVLKLERCLEDKENGALSSLKVAPGLCHNDSEASVLPTKKTSGSFGASKPPLPLQLSSHIKEISVEPVELRNSSNIFRDASWLHKDVAIQFADRSKSINLSHIVTKDVSKDAGLLSHPDANNDYSRDLLERTSKSDEFTSAQRYGTKLDKTVILRDMDSCADELSRPQYPVTIRKEVRNSASTMSETGTTTSIRDIVPPNPSKWCKQSLVCVESSSSSAGTFIAVGANGRGGQVKVLRPAPMLKVGGKACDSWLRSAKKMKSARSVQQGGSQQGSLQIEHFFGDKVLYMLEKLRGRAGDRLSCEGSTLRDEPFSGSQACSVTPCGDRPHGMMMMMDHGSHGGALISTTPSNVQGEGGPDSDLRRHSEQRKRWRAHSVQNANIPSNENMVGQILCSESDLAIMSVDVRANDWH
ncbi:hypothetical protein GOP47_0007610 [Adiantum capillus-veneris]|uniref:RING-type domain-containing protein n=1 Tax=Adiantum capillus-veneris TaxID=13818 RepID=A0A9D4ZLP4_ADICA|nr:hypothetical protein GOP47_0007610 [Adiantum capillus-veneris]